MRSDLVCYITMNKVTNNVPLPCRNSSEFKTLTLEINCNLILFQQYCPIGLWLNGTTEVLGAPQSGLFGSSLLIGWCLKGLHGTAGSVTLLPNYLHLIPPSQLQQALQSLQQLGFSNGPLHVQSAHSHCSMCHSI